MSYIHKFPDKTVAIPCDSFQNQVPGTDGFNAERTSADLFFSILKTALKTKRKSAQKDANGSFRKMPYDVFSEKILTSGKAMVETREKATQAMPDDMNGSDAVEAEILDILEPLCADETNGFVAHQTILNPHSDHTIRIDRVENLKL